VEAGNNSLYSRECNSNSTSSSTSHDISSKAFDAGQVCLASTRAGSWPAHSEGRQRAASGRAEGARRQSSRRRLYCHAIAVVLL